MVLAAKAKSVWGGDAQQQTTGSPTKPPLERFGVNASPRTKAVQSLPLKLEAKIIGRLAKSMGDDQGASVAMRERCEASIRSELWLLNNALSEMIEVVDKRTTRYDVTSLLGNTASTSGSSNNAFSSGIREEVVKEVVLEELLSRALRKVEKVQQTFIQHLRAVDEQFEQRLAEAQIELANARQDCELLRVQNHSLSVGNSLEVLTASSDQLAGNTPLRSIDEIVDLLSSGTARELQGLATDEGSENAVLGQYINTSKQLASQLAKERTQSLRTTEMMSVELAKALAEVEALKKENEELAQFRRRFAYLS